MSNPRPPRILVQFLASHQVYPSQANPAGTGIVAVISPSNESRMTASPVSIPSVPSALDPPAVAVDDKTALKTPIDKEFQYDEDYLPYHPMTQDMSPDPNHLKFKSTQYHDHVVKPPFMLNESHVKYTPRAHPAVAQYLKNEETLTAEASLPFP
ncbi:hypothetical protein GQ42DRAFT_173289 [Ramicandelaber brevisporus]|nr:hypothetical protein GQ42DRAFT_173289 [Ramicandelaber brevisporus]